MEFGDDDTVYLTLDDVLAIHNDIVNEDSGTNAGIRKEGEIEYALSHVRHGQFGEVPETIHEKAFQLMRLLAANHSFVDGNKRTALNTTVVFYLGNGYEFEYGEDVKTLLKLLATNERLIDTEQVVAYFEELASTLDADERSRVLAHLPPEVTDDIDQKVLDRLREHRSDGGTIDINREREGTARERDMATEKSPSDTSDEDGEETSGSELARLLARYDREKHRKIYDDLANE
jgi:death-on-curing protein